MFFLGGSAAPLLRCSLLIRRKAADSFRWQTNGQIFSFPFSTTTIRDFYKTLEVAETASQDEIKKAFHKFAKKHHPDIVGSSQENDDKFKELSAAYDTLSDPTKRSKYDSDRTQQKQQQQQKAKGFGSTGSQSFYERKQQHQQQHEDSQNQQQSAYSRAQNQREDGRYKNASDYNGFEQRDFDQGNLVKEGFFANMKDAPELWILSGVLALLLMRWVFLSQTESKNIHYSSDDDFEFAQPRGRIPLKDEDIQGLSLQQLDALDKTGKYVLPARVKSGIEEFRSIAKSIDFDTQKKLNEQPEDTFGEDDDDEGTYEARLQVIREEKRQLRQQKAKNSRSDRGELYQLAQKANNQQVTQTITSETQPPSSSFNYARRFAKQQQPAQSSQINSSKADDEGRQRLPLEQTPTTAV